MCGVSLNTAVTASKPTTTDLATRPAPATPATQTAAQAPTDLFENKQPPKAPVALDPWADAPAWDRDGIGGGGTGAIDPTRR